MKDIIPWDQPWGMGGVPDYLLPALKAKIQNYGPEKHLEVSECWVVALDPETPLPSMDIPPNYKVQQVGLSDVEFMDKLWKFQSSSSLAVLKGQSELGLAFGTYVDGQLKSSLVAFK